MARGSPLGTIFCRNANCERPTPARRHHIRRHASSSLVAAAAIRATGGRGVDWMADGRECWLSFCDDDCCCSSCLLLISHMLRHRDHKHTRTGGRADDNASLTLVAATPALLTMTGTGAELGDSANAGCDCADFDAVLEGAAAAAAVAVAKS
ncbi:hypothetical protein BV898_11023 [Hypsibius exemplaris]|uniref:Uncharacterized protein n=1 Tax=Hypsibius exemplaris TaxID=2072580 RepID=A0A1W0WHU5_HYPEX|nr:hypothetical protein BV898_11023 [Hypsibius exemplaris]